jgi:hypothetical protein
VRDEDNPYRPPEALIASAPLADDTGEATCWRDGNTLVVLRGRPLPPRCVKCNADARDGMRERGFVWVPLRVYLPLLLLFVPMLTPALSSRWLLIAPPLAFLATLISNVSMRRTSRHAVGLCAAHRLRHRRIHQLAILLFCAGLASPVVVDGLAPMFVMAILSVVIAWSGGRILAPTRIDDRYARYAECGETFLHSLPMLPEYRTHYLRRRTTKR